MQIVIDNQKYVVENIEAKPNGKLLLTLRPVLAGCSGYCTAEITEEACQSSTS